MIISGFASEPHYGRHVLPILDALPPEIRGPLCTEPMEVPPGPVIVAAYKDAHRMAARDLIYVEHGAGQTYGGDPASGHSRSYPGARGVAFESVRLFVCPSARVASAWTRAYPESPVVVAGDPTLDAPARRLPTANPEMAVAISFHYDAINVCPEARSALPQYFPALPEIIAELRSWGWVVLGHAHPRMASTASSMWAGLGVPFVSLDEVWARAAVYCVDNSSTLYEAAALGIPTVAMNCDHYRKNVHHGLRFWDQIPGAMIDSPDELVMAVRLSDQQDPAQRVRVTNEVYLTVDGRASERAAAAVLEAVL